jgi:hypothetical protein
VRHPPRSASPRGANAPAPGALPGAPLSSSGQLGTPAAAAPTAHPRAAGPLTFARLKWTSFAHSLVYGALLISAFAAGKPEPLTFVLGLAHGLLWIFMSLACLAATRRRVVPLRLALAVAVLGGIGPFFGSLEFVREQRARSRRKVQGGHRHPRNGPR